MAPAAQTTASRPEFPSLNLTVWSRARGQLQKRAIVGHAHASSHSTPSGPGFGNDDRGGPLGAHFAGIRDSGEQVMVDGSCFSASTLVAALIPSDRVCITERAMLRFHAGCIENHAQQRHGHYIRCIRQ
jgi:hypothetical protein